MHIVIVTQDKLNTSATNINNQRCFATHIESRLHTHVNEFGFLITRNDVDVNIGERFYLCRYIISIACVSKRAGSKGIDLLNGLLINKVLKTLHGKKCP